VRSALVFFFSLALPIWVNRCGKYQIDGMKLMPYLIINVFLISSKLTFYPRESCRVVAPVQAIPIQKADPED
jgi:hypothetical protein